MIHRPASEIAEDEPLLLPCGADEESLFLLSRAMGAERGTGELWKVNGAPALVRLGLAESPPLPLREMGGARDRERPFLKVRVTPGGRRSLADAQPARDEESPQPREAGVPRPPQEGVRFLQSE